MRIQILRRATPLVCLLALGLAPGSATPAHAQGDAIAVLEKKCFQCHGAAKMGNLDLRTREGLLKGGEKGPSVVVGNAEQSPLIHRVSGKTAPKMPMAPVPELTAAEVATLREWINQGAKWNDAPAVAQAAPSGNKERPITEQDRQWWAFQAPVRHAVPKVNDPRWSRNPIDAFVASARGAKGLSAAPEADRATLVRRLYLDLVGLLPTPAEADAFVKDTSPKAYENLVERLLASPHYGERWGRYWLDVVRYADSSGFEHDRDLATAWRFRDYVIKSLNEDKPYDRFLIEQLAGDELDEPTNDSLTATAFYRIGPRVRFREKDNPFYRYDYLDDVVRTTFQGFMGLSVHCARCHDHKFDPVSRMDYYRTLAMFFGFVNYDHPLLPREQAKEWARKTREIVTAIEPLKKEVAKIEAPYRKAQFDAGLSRLPEEVQAAIRVPPDQRTAGQKLLAAQFERGMGSGDGDPAFMGEDPALALLTTAGQRAPNVSGAPDYEGAGPRKAEAALRLSPADAERRKVLLERIAELRKQMPPTPYAVEGVRDGDFRLAPDGPGDDPLPGKTYRPDYPDLGEAHLPEPGMKYEVPWVRFGANGLVVEDDNKAPVVPAGYITVLTKGTPPPVAKPPRRDDYVTSGRRRALAEWIASPDNPLTARVLVNRVWYWHFGRGIVQTPGNFGKMGIAPTHPELLDWLATEFVRQGWSIKSLHRLILHSETYRMASASYGAGNAEKDPENIYLWRYPVRRLDGEIIRDVMLSASGQINLQAGGPPFFPSIPLSVREGYRQGKWVLTKEGPETWRRSVYSYWKRGMKYPMFDVHDQPDLNVTTEKRNITTVPTQALTLLNNEFVLIQARHLAERVKKEAGDDAAAQVRTLYRIALSRSPGDTELAGQVKFLNAQREFQAARARGDGAALAALTDLAHVMLNANEFVYIN
ncbi:MAG: PSD1 and planctomycete cytochrome C domain-containing protein [Bryobacteraceae bacterium]|nr:PSD1 and planctomycete cytochrome C domain-containing protein [Bryobacteraceae bacterium]